MNVGRCLVCEEVVVLYRGVCRRCWLESVESGIHAWADLPAELRERTESEQ
jgi:hypothetical protein